MNYSERRKVLKDRKRSNCPKVRDNEKWISINEAVEKRFKTVFVGAISKIEEMFGPLWGQDEIDEENMTPEQLKWYEIFLELRDDIFDQGNRQKNQCVKDLNRFRTNINMLVSQPKELRKQNEQE